MLRELTVPGSKHVAASLVTGFELYASQLLLRQVPGSIASHLMAGGLTHDYLTDLKGLSELVVNPVSRPPSVRDLLDQQESLARRMLAIDAHDYGACFVLGRSLAYQRRDEEAVATLSELIAGRPTKEAFQYRTYSLPHRAVCLARLGDADGAWKDLANLKESATFQKRPKQWQHAISGMLGALIDVYLGKTESGINALKTLLKNESVESRFYGAAGMSEVAGFLDDQSTEQARQCLALAESGLRALVSEQLVSANRVYETTELATVREQRSFGQWLVEQLKPISYSMIWHTSSEFVARESHGKSIPQHLEDCEQLINAGFVPASISVLKPDHDRPSVTASVWHQPCWTALKHDQQTRRLRAAAALISFKPDGPWWALLKPHRDPTFATRLVHRLSRFGVSLSATTRALEEASDPQLQRQLIIAGCESGWSDTSSDERSEFISAIRNLMAESDTAGIHSTSIWALRQMELRDESTRTSVDLNSSPTAHGSRVITESGLEMVAVVPDETFRIGSPVSEQGRSIFERRVSVSGASPWLISTTEITTGHFKQVGLRAVESNGSTAAMASWYEAAEFCNRLSELEGLDSSEWYYAPNLEGEYAEGMKCRPVSASLQGYRLPTESEWEFTCRARTNTAWQTGNDSEFLEHYAWFLNDSLESPAMAGLLRPNALGCFDMAGNLPVWCHEPWSPTRRNLSTTADEVVEADTKRVARGGSFNLTSRHCRSAARALFLPHQRITLGFRVVRGWPSDDRS